ncbi:GrpB family protein [Actinoplanes couchii]|uniref:GrpB family protein n=1 Tax=Actinoplanes couchii TaxID=403638 RepID=UPI0019405462|nr:GrpB family protein [Actinoplanes couchii]MDR6319314.1 GrpB-like predicted nucleotidyltransferase (UPF0157 family) [Actinoplanes couchii]
MVIRGEWVASVLVDAYDVGWVRRGEAVVREVAGGLGSLAVRVEHIGSTAVPGMAAKPVFDVQASVLDLDVAFDGPLTGLGFERLPYQHDHVPAGCGDSPALWVKRFWLRRGDGVEPVNLHLRLAGSPNERLALLFRDWFRAHPAAVPAYAAFKSVLAVAVDGDLDAYTEVKDPVVDLVAVVAEEWAAATGWG